VTPSLLSYFLPACPLSASRYCLGIRAFGLQRGITNPWVRSRQELLEADVRNASANDPLIIAGTKQVQIQ
jgi:hypothetical protein